MSKTVAQLPAASALSGAELVHLVQGGNSRRSTVDAVASRVRVVGNHVNMTAGAYQWSTYVSEPAGNYVVRDITNDLYPFRVESGAANNSLSVASQGAVLFGVTPRPNTDNALTLGTSSFRWSVVYAGTGTINTSDKRAKSWQRSALTESEIAAGDRIVGELGYYQFLDAIAEKGVENARWHFGAQAQDVVRIFAEEGVEDIDPALLDIEPDVFVPEVDRPSMRQAFLTFDTWDNQYEPEYEMVTVTREEDGEIVEELVEQPTGNQILVRAAGNIFGFRPEQLTLFLLRVSHELRLRDKAAAELRMDALEQRIAALEGA